MENIFTELIEQLIKTSPVVGILCYIIYYLHKEKVELQKEKKELIKSITEDSKNQIKTLGEIANVLDKINEQAIDHFKDLKELIKENNNK